MNNKIKIKYSIYYLAALIFIVFASCNHSDKNSATIKMLDESVVISTRIIHEGSRDVYDRFGGLVNDPPTSKDAKIWQEKALNVKGLSDSLFNEIERIKQIAIKKTSLTENSIEELFNKMNHYKSKVLNSFDSVQREQFAKEIIVFSRAFDSIKHFKEDCNNFFFSGNSLEINLIVLNKFQHNIRIIEKLSCDYFIANVAKHRDFIMDYYTTLVFQNKTYVRKGDELEIGAGMGAFSTEIKPEIVINGKKMNLEVDGVARYKIIASGDVGVHQIPVEISYIKNDGSKGYIKKIITYTVEK
jgi:hypothetical protein